MTRPGSRSTRTPSPSRPRARSSPPASASGTPALTTRGMKEAQMEQVASFIARVVDAKGDEAVIEKVRKKVGALSGPVPDLPGFGVIHALSQMFWA